MTGWFLKEAHIKGIGDLIINTEVTITHGKSIFGLMSSKQFFKDVVLPNLTDFYASPLDVRKAINACISLYHLSDWHWLNLDKNAKNVKRNAIPYNTALESITNGSKHFNTQKPYQSGEIDGSYTKRALTLNCDEKTIVLKDMLQEIQKFWENELS